MTPVLGLGGGADVRLGRHFAFRFQLRDLVALDDDAAGGVRRHRLLFDLEPTFRW